MKCQMSEREMCVRESKRAANRIQPHPPELRVFQEVAEPCCMGCPTRVCVACRDMGWGCKRILAREPSAHTTTHSHPHLWMKVRVTLSLTFHSIIGSRQQHANIAHLLLFACLRIDSPSDLGLPIPTNLLLL